ncbi:hypothetical protein CPB84DRAFT_1790967 [Gymnopilus junonius]|uniref:Uncharacterized protein n=1 Tax=Gymnopilus junonius TaxID=109634 RepID=A0A9P5THQ8_GYMJU|nr:hypothetical protein CPB84DRAFT_1790967 [Gymnopilus junonius]
MSRQTLRRTHLVLRSFPNLAVRTPSLNVRRIRIRFGAVVDYLLLYPDKALRDRIIKSKAFAFTDIEVYKLLKCTVYEAKPEELFSATASLPQAATAATTEAQHLELNTFRGCVTSGTR